MEPYKEKLLGRSKSKTKDIYTKPIKKAEFGIGAKGSSYIKVTSPFILNENGSLDVKLFFSGVKIEVWFKASLNSKNLDGKPKEKDLIPDLDLTKTIKF